MFFVLCMKYNQNWGLLQLVTALESTFHADPLEFALWLSGYLLSFWVNFPPSYGTPE